MAIRLVAFGIFLIALFFLATATDHPRARYGKYNCQYQMIYGQQGDVEMVAIGSSRSLQGLDAPILSEALGGGVVYNLAKNWRGQGINYRLLEDAITNRKVKYALVEANLPEGQIYHAHFFVVGTLGDWWRSFQYRAEASGTWTAAQVTVRKVFDRFVEQATLLVGGKLFADASVPVNAETGYCRNREERIRADYLAKQKERYFKYYEDKAWSWKFADEKAAHDFGFFKKMVEVAEQQGTILRFYHINQAYYSTLDPEFAATFEAEVGAPILIPPASLTREIEEMDGYADATHMTLVGREYYTHWLAGAFKSSLPQAVKGES